MAVKKQHSLNEPLKWAKEKDGGLVRKAIGDSRDGIFEWVPIYDPEEDEDALRKVANELEGYVEESGMLEKAGMEKTQREGSSNKTINSLITRTVENPKVAGMLSQVAGKWHDDPDYVVAVARIIKKNYANFNFTEPQLIKAIGELYG